MKKTLVSFLLAAFLLSVPFVSEARSSESETKSINGGIVLQTTFNQYRGYGRIRSRRRVVRRRRHVRRHYMRRRTVRRARYRVVRRRGRTYLIRRY